MGLNLITPPAIYSVTLPLAKAHCGVTHDDQDVLINMLIAAATDYVEQTLSTSIAEQTWELTLDDFSDAIALRRGPVKSVLSVKYDDAAGAEQTLVPSAYTLDRASSTPWLVRNAASGWPATMAGINAVRIRYVTGMEVVPPSLGHAMLLLIGHWFANRETVVVGTTATDLPLGVDALLWPYRRISV